VDFPKTIDDGDLDLWLKELKLSGGFRSWGPTFSMEPGYTIHHWECQLDTDDYIVWYRKFGPKWVRQGEPLRRGLVEHLSASILDNLRQPSILSQVLPPTPVEAHDAEEKE
jgi:hypothetical protein